MDVTLKNQTSDVGVKESVPDPTNNGVGADSCETVATESNDKLQTVTEEPPTDAEDDRPSDVMEESQSARSDDTMQNGLDESADRGVEDELNLGSKDDEVSMNPSESIANPGEDDTSMNVSEGDGEQSMEAVESEQPMEADDQSMDQDMQVEKADKDISETMDVSVANVDIQGGDESMEVASPSAVDPICLGDALGESQGPTCEEQMEINEAVEDDSTIQTTDKADEDIEKSEDVSEAEKKSDEEQHEDKAEEGTSEQERITEDTQDSNVGGATADPVVAETEDTQDSNPSAPPTGETAADPAVAETEDTQDSNASVPTGGATADPVVVETEDTHDSNASAPPTEETVVDPAVAETEDTQDSNTSAPTGETTADPVAVETEDTQDSNASAPTGKTTADPVEAETEDTQDSSVKAPTGEGTVAETGQKETIAEVQDSNASKPESESTEENKESNKDGVIVFSGSVLKSSEKEQKADDGDIVEVVVEKPRSGRKSSNAERKSETSYSPEPEQRPQRPKRQAATRAESQIKELAEEDSNSNEGFGDKKEIVEIEPCSQMCFQCCRVKVCHFQGYAAGRNRFLCEDTCVSTFRKQTSKTRSQNLQDRSKRIDTERIFVRKCSQCTNVVKGEEKNLSWETMDFCNEECLGKYQTALGSHCANCKGAVQPVSLGKYCVRFGYDIKQFCCSTCLEEFKKGLKVCSYCQKDISSGAEGFLAPVGDKGQFKDFCTQQCMEKYDQMSNNQPPPLVMHSCSVCQEEKIVKVEVLLEDKLHKLCSEPCFAAFKFVNNINADRCDMCKKYFDRLQTEVFSVYYDDSPHSFCCKTCMNVYILANRKIVPCNWCKVKKYNFDMIKRVDGKGQVFMMCSLNCLTLYQVSLNAVSAKRIKCDYCSSVAQAQYHLTMSDATIRNFCTYQCVMSYQGQFSKTTPLNFSSSGTQPIPTGGPQRAIPNARRSVPITQNETQLSKGSAPTAMPVISNVTSLATHNGPQVNNSNIPAAPPQPPKTFYKQQVIVKPPPPKEMKNKSVLCKPYMHTKGVSCRPHPCTKETQTDDTIGKKIFIPVPVPIYVPAPMHMYSNPFPVPVPFPLPVPVPIFIPTTRNSAQGIMKEIKRIQEKIPTDPFEAELLMMAEMVAGEKKAGENSDSESDDGGTGAGDVSEVPGGSSAAEGGFSPEAVDTSNTFGEDMLQMALKMASELEEPAVDLEAALTPSTITAQSQPSMEQNDATESEVDDPEPVQSMPEARANRGRKRGMRSSRGGSSGGSTPAKRGRRISSSVDIPLLPPPEPQPPPRVEQEKPDANMCLKYTFGVNAWRQWVLAKNAELEKAATNNRKLKLFKPEILQLTADELNYSLCLFVKEVRKPNGSEYAPDTIYYLCLGIQQYLFENGRIDNIFTDSYYEKFTECLDEVAKKFTALYNDSQYIVTRVEEEHLWESKQLGAHSPHVLLSTLMFFNTKHFNLTTVEEHMQLSFSHIMKHWKRNPNQPGVTKIPGSSRNVLLRFYPPQSALENNARKKKVYEQQENEENPLRCPVKLYEFYLSKCPESVKTRNDVFYLLPERSCVPDSPVWYSTMALGKEPLMKMLHRVKMVKEINIALLTS